MPGKGSTFTLFLPVSYRDPEGTPRRKTPTGGTETASPTISPARSPYVRPNPTWRPTPTPSRGTAAPPAVDRRAKQYVVEDDHENIDPGDKTLLIIENDVNFAKVLLEMAREKQFKGIVALDGDNGLAAAQEYRPDAITLDIDLPGMDGWKVMERLKHNPSTRHIPVHIISGIERRQQGLRAGAMAYLAKPVSKDALDEAFSRITNFLNDVPEAFARRGG
jgi:CheY-like chemotaxis protein